MISPEYPYPRKCGFTIRLADLCENLFDIAELHIFVIGPSQENIQKTDIFKSVTFYPQPEKHNFIRDLAICAFKKIVQPYFDSKIYVSNSILKRIERIHRDYVFDAVMVHTPLLARCLRAFPGSVKKIIDSHDIWHQKYSEMAKMGHGRILWHFRDLWCEINLYKSVDLVLAISLWDREFMISHGVKPVYVPVSFTPEPLEEKTISEANVLFAAGSGYANVDAIIFFMREILPLVSKSVPGARLLVPNACVELRQEYSGRPDIGMLPFLSDIREAYKMADIVVAPLRYGSGLKIKVLESFAFGKPTILSSSAAQGIALANYAQRHISNKPEILAGEIVMALKELSYRKKLADSGLGVIRDEYNAAKVYGALREMIFKA